MFYGIEVPDCRYDMSCKEYVLMWFVIVSCYHGWQWGIHVGVQVDEAWQSAFNTVRNAFPSIHLLLPILPDSIRPPESRRARYSYAYKEKGKADRMLAPHSSAPSPPCSFPAIHYMRLSDCALLDSFRVRNAEPRLKSVLSE